MEKAEKLVVNLHDKNEYVMHMKNLKQTLKSRISVEKVRRVIKFNQEVG